MGQIKSIIFNTKVETPLSNSEFSITASPNQVHIRYRNIGIHLKTTDFRLFASRLQSLQKDAVVNFDYGSGSFLEALCFLGVNSTFPSHTRFCLFRHKDNLYKLRYRCLTVDLSKSEATAITPYVSTINSTPLQRMAKKLAAWNRQPVPALDQTMLHNRLSLDLCENIHLHFQNLRFEFSKPEFLLLWDAVSSINLRQWNFLLPRKLCCITLPAVTEWNNRFQLEEQVEGHYHLHYRNLRVEFRTFSEVGLGLGGGKEYFIDQEYKTKAVEALQWKLSGIQSATLSELKAIVYTDNGFIITPLENSPIYKSLLENKKEIYDAYTAIVKRHHSDCPNTWARFQSLFASIKADGYHEKNLIISKGDRTQIWDGQHRACILLHLYGKQKSIKLAHYVDQSS